MRSRTLIATAALALVAAAPAWADGAQSWNVCGGNAFNTCASVSVSVTGTTVTMRVMNLSGLNGTYGSTVFTSVGLFNVPTAVNAVVPANGLVTGMTGGVRGSDTPSAWRIRNNTQVGGGVQLDLVGSTPNGINGGIASNCAATGTLPGGKNQLWMTENAGCTPGYSVTNGSLNGGFIQFSFTVSQTWDPSQGTELLVKGQNGPNGASTECITGPNGNCGPLEVVPEPITMILLGTGLAGMGGAGVLRRRRNKITDA